MKKVPQPRSKKWLRGIAIGVAAAVVLIAIFFAWQLLTPKMITDFIDGGNQEWSCSRPIRAVYKTMPGEFRSGTEKRWEPANNQDVPKYCQPGPAIGSNT